MRIFALKIVSSKQLKNGVFITQNISARWQQAKGKIALPVDRPTVKFMTVEPTGRPPGRPGLDSESKGSLAGQPLGRPELDTESRALCRSTGRSTGAIPESRSSLAVDRPGRPASSQRLRAHSVHVGLPVRSTDFCLGRPVWSTGRQPDQHL